MLREDGDIKLVGAMIGDGKVVGAMVGDGEIIVGLVEVYSQM